MKEDRIRCPAFCIKTITDEQGNIIKKVAGYLETVKGQEQETGRLFCLTANCPFAFRDEHNKDQWISNADLLKIPLEDPFIEVNVK
jgi:hypothetical protein